MYEQEFQKAGKEVQDIIQALVDPNVSMDKSKEIVEGVTALWNLKDKVPMNDIRDVIIHVLLGALQETATEYFPIGGPTTTTP